MKIIILVLNEITVKEMSRNVVESKHNVYPPVLSELWVDPRYQTGYQTGEMYCNNNINSWYSLSLSCYNHRLSHGSIRYVAMYAYNIIVCKPNTCCKDHIMYANHIFVFWHV